MEKAIISSGKRSLEEKIVQRFLKSEAKRFAEIVEAIRKANWYVLSARRSEELMKAKLFERILRMKDQIFQSCLSKRGN